MRGAGCDWVLPVSHLHSCVSRAEGQCDVAVTVGHRVGLLSFESWHCHLQSGLGPVILPVNCGSLVCKVQAALSASQGDVKGGEDLAQRPVQ